MQDLLLAFAHIEHPCDNGSFSCTFSAGVAKLEEGMSAQHLSQIADIALYQAKKAGRNQVHIFEQ